MSSTPTKTLSLILFLTFISLSHARLSVISSSPLFERRRFSSGRGLGYVSLIPQHKVIYKNPFTGVLVLAGPREDACDPIADIPLNGENAVSNPIVIATWGECSPLQKVRNAELAGAKLLILNLKEGMGLDHPSLQNLQITSNIEVVAIMKVAGDELIEALKEVQNKPKNDPESIIEMRYTWEPTNNANYVYTGGKVFIDYWMPPIDVSMVSYDFLGQLGSVLEKFGSDIEFHPRYVFWENTAVGWAGFRGKDDRCVSGGRYCDPQTKIENRLYGDEAVLEALRQICLRDLDDVITPNSNWWKYIFAYVNKCVDTDKDKNPNCHEKAFKAANIPRSIVDKVNTCMRESFGASVDEDLARIYKDNSKLSAELSAKDEMEAEYYPALYANKDKYAESMRMPNREKLSEFICSHFNRDLFPKACTAEFIKNEKVQPETEVETSTDVVFYVGVVLVCVLFMAIVLYCAKEGVKRELKKTMNNELARVAPRYEEIQEEPEAQV